MKTKPKDLAKAKTASVPMTSERVEFSGRLIQAIESLDHKNLHPGPTFLAHNFNHRYAGKPVTVHAARKWLMGEAIPTQAKLICLANWLNVKPE